MIASSLQFTHAQSPIIKLSPLVFLTLYRVSRTLHCYQLRYYTLTSTNITLATLAYFDLDASRLYYCEEWDWDDGKGARCFPAGQGIKGDVYWSGQHYKDRM